MATNTRLVKLLEAYGPRTRVAYARWTPSSDATQTLTESQGITSITRSGAGAYTANLAVKPEAMIALIQCVENDTTTQHYARIESTSATAGTVTVSHKTLALTTVPGQRVEYFNTYLADVSTASSAFVYAPVAGTLISAGSVLGAAITGTDSAMTTEINGAAVTQQAAWTIAQSGSAAGDRDSVTYTAANTVAAGDAIEFITDGASTNTAPLHITCAIRVASSEPAGSDTVDELELLVIMRVAT